MIYRALLLNLLITLSVTAYGQTYYVDIYGPDITEATFWDSYEVSMAGTDMVMWTVTAEGIIEYYDAYSATINWVSGGYAMITYESQDYYGYYYGEKYVSVGNPPPPTPNAAVIDISYYCGDSTSVARSYLSPDEDYEWYWQTTAIGESTLLGKEDHIILYTTTPLYLRARDKTSFIWSNDSQYLGDFTVYTTTPSIPDPQNYKFIGASTRTLQTNIVPDAQEYSWYNESQVYIISTNSPSFTRHISSSINYYISAKNACGESGKATISVDVAPEPVITSSADGINMGESVTLGVGFNYDSYLWKASNGGIIETSPTYTTNKAGSYKVEVFYGDDSKESALFEVKDVMETVNQNYVISENILVPGITNSVDIDVLTVDQRSRTIQYFDGLGRPMQQINQQASAGKKDIIVPIEYDQFGRQHKDYLPYVDITENNGFYKENALNAAGYTFSDHYNYYNDPLISDVARDQMPYAEKDFEASPLNRVLEQGAPGAAWQPGSGHTIKYQYLVNTLEENVISWQYDHATANIIKGGSFGTGELYVNLTTDEEGYATREYIDKQGRTVLKKVQEVELPRLSHKGWLCTYYVYDDLNNLKAVIPPQAVYEMDNQTPAADYTLVNDAVFSKNWLFTYKYDSRQRMIEKQVPGAEPVYMVYDKRDRLVLTQDGNQRNNAAPEWTFTKYDMLNRPILTGIHDTTAILKQAEMQQVVDAHFDKTSSEWYETLNGPVHGYTNKSYPVVGDANKYLTVTYYDNYSFPHASGKAFVPESGHTGAFMQVKGQVTGTKTKVLDDSNLWLEDITYYDDRYRIIQNIMDNHKGGAERVTNTYDFAGKVISSFQTHGDGTTILREYEYDHAGRLLDTRHSLNRSSNPVAWTDLVGVKVENESLVKTATDGYGNAGAASINKLDPGEDGWIEVTVDSNYRVLFGFSEINEDAHYNTIDYSIYLSPAWSLTAYENGSSTGGMGSYSPGDVIRVERIGSTIYYKKNGTLLKTSTVPSSGILVADVALYYTGDKITNARMSKGASVIVASNSYNELGELVEKNLHSEDGISYAQSVDYRYNIRGWLNRINNSDLSETEQDAPGDYFGFELAYNDSWTGIGNLPLFNGNISAVKWSTGFGTSMAVNESAYSYGYDPVNRIKGAEYLGKIAGIWTGGNKYDVSAITYDLNGNLQSLTRNNISGTGMDILTYNYGENSSKSNQLLTVTDAEVIAEGKEPEGFNDGNSGSQDYDYDDNGNMFKDLNKGITNIEYNYLNLPVKVEKDLTNYIEYVYDATGIKLAQVVYETGKDSRRTDYIGNFIYEQEGTGDPKLQLIQHDEGRIVYDPITENLEYQYHLKDHLGNSRITFTTRPKNITFKTNYENDPGNADDLNLFEEVTTSGIEEFNHTPGTYIDGTPYIHSQVLRSSTHSQIGSAIPIPVGEGDRINVSAFAKFVEASADPSVSASTLASALISAFTEGTGTITEGAKATINNNFGSGSLIGTMGFPYKDKDAPKAFLNLMFLPDDEAIELVKDESFSYDQIELNASETVGDGIKNAFDQLLIENFTAPGNGHILIYFSNEGSLTDVHFDDITIDIEEHPVVQRDDYYPFGLTFNSYQRSTAKENKYLYSGKERINDLDIAWDDFHARIYMPDIGRWNTIDPMAHNYDVVSPYVYAVNNPILFIDPDGRDIILSGVSRRELDILERIINQGLQGQFEAKFTNVKGAEKGTLSLSLVATKDGGDLSQMTDEGKSFYQHLNDGINDKEKNTQVEVVFGEAHVKVGNFNTSQLDIADVDQFNEGGSAVDYSQPTGATKQGKLIHELVEQHEKAKGKDYKPAHRTAVGAENDVNGNTKLWKRLENGDYNDTFFYHGTSNIRTVFREKDGSRTTVIYKHTSGVIKVKQTTKPTALPRNR